MNMSYSKAKCPKCGCRNLLITEFIECTKTWEQIDGQIDLKEGYNNEGDIIGLRGKCLKCGHKWKFRCLQIWDIITKA